MGPNHPPVGSIQSASEGCDAASFLRWARSAARSFVPGEASGADFAELDGMIGNASIVALGEAEHLLDEPLAFRNALLRHLVEDKGFTAIALESGVVEARGLHEYIFSGEGSRAAAIVDGLSWTFETVARNHELVDWLRAYNADPTCRRKIRFYGFDIAGSPTVPTARRGVDTALVEALRFLARADPAAARIFEERYAPFAARLRFDLTGRGDAGYETLTIAERDTLTMLVADLVAHVEANAAAYSTATTDRDYRWGLRTAIAAQQVDSWLRGVPLGYDASADALLFLHANADVRDRIQADNIEWIVREEGEAGKLLVFAHNNHLAMRPTEWNWAPLLDGVADRDQSITHVRKPTGVHLRRRFGNRLVTIAHLAPHAAIHPAPVAGEAASYENLLAEIDATDFLLDLRVHPSGSKPAVFGERRLGAIHALRGAFCVELRASIEGAYDILYFTHASTPAARAVVQ